MKTPVEKVLVVDDLEENRDVLARRLERDGCEVLLACGGREALDAIAESSPDVVLLDMMMPGIDGLEVIKRTRSNMEISQPLILVVSARHDTSTIIQALLAGADDYVTKPYEFQVVRARMKRNLDRSRSAKLTRDVNTRLVDRLYKLRGEQRSNADEPMQS